MPVDSSFHDLILVDGPKFHFAFQFGKNIEVYHLTIRGANLGSYDGIDAVGENYLIHDNKVSQISIRVPWLTADSVRSQIAISASA